MILSAFCLREARDIDFIALTSLENKFSKKENNNINNHNSEFEKYLELNIESAIKDNRFYFTFKGIKFVSIEILYAMKRNRKEYKDKIDNCLIKTILKFNLFNFLYANLSERI